VENFSGAARKGAGERALLARIRTRAGPATGRNVALGMGDDCALLRLRAGEELAVTTDLSIDGRHFRLDWHPPESAGHRTLARGLSDLAAMGARPVAAFLSLGLPADLAQDAGARRADSGERGARRARLDRTWADRFLDGFLKLADAYNVPLAGGDLAQSPLAVADIVLTGAVKRGKALLRSGARPGDELYLTGALGAAAAGLRRLEELAGARGGKRTPGPLIIPKKLETELEAHFYPQPRVEQGLALVRRGMATAAIDLSDGLSTDLHHLCDESGVAAEVEAAALPIAARATLEEAVHGGEDYELLFTAALSARVPRSLNGIPVTRIGCVRRRRTGRPRVTLIDADGWRALEPRGWEHFS
jgi:thiamine-monophosphate kinase